MSVTHTDDEFAKKYREEHGPNWKWFVWVNTLTGPMPQAWGEVGEQQAANVRVLQKHPITPDDTWLHLDQLARKYPYVAPTE